jgi:hypothetical protein
MTDEQQGGIGGLLGGIGKAAGGMGDAAKEQMAITMIKQALGELNYPVTKADLAAEAQRRGAPSQITDILAKMPDRQYVSVDDVSAEAQTAWKG